MGTNIRVFNRVRHFLDPSFALFILIPYLDLNRIHVQFPCVEGRSVHGNPLQSSRRVFCFLEGRSLIFLPHVTPLVSLTHLFCACTCALWWDPNALESASQPVVQPFVPLHSKLDSTRLDSRLELASPGSLNAFPPHINIRLYKAKTIRYCAVLCVVVSVWKCCLCRTYHCQNRLSIHSPLLLFQAASICTSTSTSLASAC